MDLDLRRVFKDHITILLPGGCFAGKDPGTRIIPTMVIHRIHVCLAIDQFCHHPLHSKASSQDQGCGAIIHPGIQISYSVADQNLEEEKVQKRESTG